MTLAGGFMNVQGGSVLQVGSVYYWVGIQFAKDGQYPFGAVNLYKSTDLVNWTWVKAILTPQQSGDLAAGRWVGRPDLVYNPTTQTYILVLEIDGTGYNVGPGNMVGFASSSSVESPYTYLGSTACRRRVNTDPVASVEL
jgi:beta-xylosidase